MLGTEYKWLLASVRTAAIDRAHLARRSFLTLAVAGFCLLCTFVMPAPSLTPAVKVAAPVVAALDQPDVELPHTLIQLWFLLPQLLPERN